MSGNETLSFQKKVNNATGMPKSGFCKIGMNIELNTISTRFNYHVTS
jgi:hypothetical protein